MKKHTTFPDEEARWLAVTARDPSADGMFFYGVKSTGVYCRPNCPSRLPRRENALFFDSTGSAEQAGYRACKRCRPDATHPRALIVQQMCEVINEHLDQKITLAMLSEKIGLSAFHLQRLFKEILGVSPRQYQEAQRLQAFKKSLQAGVAVTDAVYAAGFASSSRLYEAAKKQMGMAPKSYRDKGAGMSIRFTCVQSSFGNVLVAATAAGLCSVALGDDSLQLEANLRVEFGGAAIVRDDVLLVPYVDRLRAYLQGDTRRFDLPLDIRATVFQRQVWELLRNIPHGETRSYSEIAQQLGNPKAVRAVATACANNPIAIAIPCHRVVQKSGALAGYRWGLSRKAALLAAEQKKKK